MKIGLRKGKKAEPSGRKVKRQVTEQAGPITVGKIGKGAGKPCSVCHQELRRIKWNTKCDLLVCDNSDCYLSRQPVEIIMVEKRSIIEVNKED